MFESGLLPAAGAPRDFLDAVHVVLPIVNSVGADPSHFPHTAGPAFETRLGAIKIGAFRVAFPVGHSARQSKEYCNQDDTIDGAKILGRL